MKWFLALCLMAAPASAHEWFTQKHDPATGRGCCGGSDCKTVPEPMMIAGVVQEVQGGYLVQLTPKQIKYFAPGNGYPNPIKQVIPWSRVQPSETAEFALCIVWNQVRCFFAPQTS